MYQKYFGLNEEPFSIAVNPQFLYMSDRHREALAHLLYGVSESGGIILLTGEVGTGKTTITRCLLKQLPENTDVAIVLNPALSALELLAAVCREFRINPPDGELSLRRLSDLLYEFLLKNYQRGRNTILLIDEAQHLQPDVLEQIRLLTNLETETRKLLKIILVGQPELKAILDRPELRQVSQRITAQCMLESLDRRETESYIRHRLMVAGLPANTELFPHSVVAAIHRASRGVPRLINILCDRMLLGTYGQSKPRVDRAMARQAIREVFATGNPALRLAAPPRAIASVLLVGVAVAGLGFWWRVQIPVADDVSWPRSSETVMVAERDTQATEQPAPATEVSEPEHWFGSQADAFNALLDGVHYQVSDRDQPCKQSGHALFQCERGSARVWSDLLAYNRPAVLELVTPARFRAFAALLGVRGEIALLLTPSSGITEYPLASLGKLWTGNYLFAWKPPPGYSKPIGPGQTGLTVKWLAEQFALLDGQDFLLSDGDYNSRLAERVRLFQRNRGLDVDGVAGLKTLLELNEILDREATLTTSLGRDKRSG